MVKTKKTRKPIHKEVAHQMITLLTSSLGLVAALAWNEVIKTAVDTYIKPFFGEASGLISLIIYAVAVTTLVVIVTYNLARFVKKD